MKKKQLSNLSWLVHSLLIISLSLFLLGQNLAQASAADSCFSNAWPHERSDLVPDPAVMFGKLKNGFRYVIKANDTPRDRVAIYLNVQAGSIHEKDNERGYAHFLEHMLFNGSTHFPPGKLIEYFQEIGMDFGADTNAYTTLNETVYMINLPDGELADLQKGFLVMSDYAQGALLLPEEVERERKVILAEKLARDSVEYRTHVATTQNAVKGTVLANRQPIGTEAAIKSATSESLGAFYDKWYRPENMILIVVGDIDEQLVKKEIVKTFTALEARGERPECPQIGSLTQKGLRSFYYNEPEAGNTDVAIEFYYHKKPDDDSFALQLNNLREFVATSILRKRFEKIAEENVGLLLYPRVYSGDLLPTVGYSGLSASTSAERWPELLTMLETGLRQGLEFGVTQNELELAKSEVLSYLFNQAKKAENRQSTQIMRQLIFSINNNRVFQSPDQEKKLYSVAAQSFTIEEINTTLAKLFQRKERLIEVTGDVVIQSKDPQETILGVYYKASEQQVAEYEAEGVIDFPYLKSGYLSVPPIEHIRYKEIDVDRYRYANGTTLNLKQTDFKRNEVSINIEFGSGELGEPIAGMGLLAESVINNSGTGQLTESQLDEVLSGSSVVHSFAIDESRFKLRGRALASEMELLLQTLQTILRDPGIRRNAYDNVMVSFEQWYRSMLNDIRGVESLEVQPYLAGGNYLFGIAPFNNIKGIDLEMIEDWLLPVFSEAALEISIVGDFERENVLDLVSRYFGSLPARSAINPEKISVQFPAGEKEEFVISSKIDQALLVMAWKTTGFQDISVVRRLNSLASIFEERIRLAIREQLGATYSPVAFNSSSRIAPDYGKLYVRIVTDPGQLAKVQDVVASISRQLIEDGVTQEELERVKRPNLTSLKDLVRTNNYWLNSVLSGSTQQLDQLRWPETIIEDNAAITAAEISAFAKLYLQPERLVVATVQPTR